MFFTERKGERETKREGERNVYFIIDYKFQIVGTSVPLYHQVLAVTRYLTNILFEWLPPLGLHPK